MKSQYYPVTKFYSGVKANLQKLIIDTIKQTLEKIGYDKKREAIHCTFVFGADGAGYSASNINSPLKVVKIINFTSFFWF